MRERMTAIVAIILLLTLIAASYWYAVRASYSNLKYVPNENSPDFIAKDISMVQFDENGMAKSKLQAQEFKHYSDDRITMIEPRAISVAPNEQVTKASAQSGRSDDGGETFVFEGSVKSVREANEKTPLTQIETQQVTVYPESNLIESDSHVVMTSGQDRMEGEGMIFDNVEQTVELKKNVKTVIQPKANSKNLLTPQ